MPWSRATSERRIQEALKTVPTGQVEVVDFDLSYLSARRAQIDSAVARGLPREDPIVRIPPSQAVVVHGVHVYAQLIDYHAALVDLGRETEASHDRALQLLHLHYAACDSMIEAFEAQRVDYHGPRLHAVVATPVGPASEPERVARAVAFATSLKQAIEAAGARLGGNRLGTRVRIGIDTGPAVAVNSGRSNEQEPLFLGNPANYAAKLAEGGEPGIFLSDRARAALALPQTLSFLGERASALDVATLGGIVAGARGRAAAQALAPLSRPALDAVVASLGAQVGLADGAPPRAAFAFHRHEPPLRTIDYAELMPSRSIRMPLASIFADLSGFTAYVAACIVQGRVPQLVANLHVIRRELAAALRDDFGGRKVRFIGDCVHGLLAMGTRTETDLPETVRAAVLCAGGLRSSFQLCQRLLPGIDGLGLAVGIEVGETPVTRLGLRGDRSVRCASSRAVSRSEECQGACEGDETALGPSALLAAPAPVRRAFAETGKVARLDYAAAEALFVSRPAVVTGSGPSREFRPHAGGPG